MKTKEDLLTDLKNKIFDSSSIIKLESYAGTGKTTTLEEIFKFYPEKRILYLVFNASMRDEAKSRLANQKNVRVSTLHGLAYPFFKNKYPDVELQNDITIMDIKEHFRIEDTKLAFRIIDEYKSFLASNHTLEDLHKDTSINEKLEFEELEKYEKEKEEHPEKTFKPSYIKDPSVKYRFSKHILSILDLQENGELGFTHDTYLKLYQLSNPNLDRWYDLIAIDEAQDITMSTVQLFMNQKCMKIIVGDRYQNIYGFRKTTNALEIVNTPHTYELSKSYRIGQEIANLSSDILSKRYQNSVKITGVNISKLSNRNEIPENSKIHIISRKTITLLIEAKSLMEEDIPFSFVGGINSYGVKNALNLLMYGSIYYKGKKLSRGEIYELFEETEDPELGVMISIERAFNSPDNLKELIESEVKEKDAKVVLTTAHRSKGLEWDNVLILDDFNLIDVKTELKQEWSEELQRNTNIENVSVEQVDTQEYNLFYVAITRAKINLVLDYNMRKQVELIRKYL